MLMTQPFLHEPFWQRMELVPAVEIAHIPISMLLDGAHLHVTVPPAAGLSGSKKASVEDVIAGFIPPLKLTLSAMNVAFGVTCAVAAPSLSPRM
jgi:hypothetical protein